MSQHSTGGYSEDAKILETIKPEKDVPFYILDLASGCGIKTMVLAQENQVNIIYVPPKMIYYFSQTNQ